MPRSSRIFYSLGKRFTAAQWFDLPLEVRKARNLAQRMTGYPGISRSDASLIGQEMGLEKFPGREVYVDWILKEGNYARGEHMLEK